MPSTSTRKSQGALKVAPIRRTPRSKKVIPNIEPAIPEITVQPSASNKQSQLIELLHRPSGATLVELMAATGWQAHSVRGVISGVLRKRLQYLIELETSADGIRCYRIVAGGPA
jgi:hypothetical protein